MNLWCTLPAVLASQAHDPLGIGGSPDGSQWRINVGFALQRKGKGFAGMLAEPFKEELSIVNEAVTEHGPHHAVHDALRWQQMLKLEPSLCPADISRWEGVSRAHVSYRMQLLSLGPKIRAFLLSLREVRSIRFFGRIRLLRLTALPVAEQNREFEQLLAQYKIHSIKSAGSKNQSKTKAA